MTNTPKHSSATSSTTGSILPRIVCHILNNSSAVFLQGVYPVPACTSHSVSSELVWISFFPLCKKTFCPQKNQIFFPSLTGLSFFHPPQWFVKEINFPPEALQLWWKGTTDSRGNIGPGYPDIQEVVNPRWRKRKCALASSTTWWWLEQGKNLSMKTVFGLKFNYAHGTRLAGEMFFDQEYWLSADIFGVTKSVKFHRLNWHQSLLLLNILAEKYWVVLQNNFWPRAPSDVLTHNSINTVSESTGNTVHDLAFVMTNSSTLLKAQ